MARRNKMFTVYDVLDAKGYFDNNPANAQSDNYQRAEWPRMYYHPAGAERISKQAEIIVTPLGPKAVGEQRELICKVAKTEAEAEALVSEGWHDHPSKAVASRPKRSAGGGAEAQIQALEQANREMQAQLNSLRAAQLTEMDEAAKASQAAAAAPTKSGKAA